MVKLSAYPERNRKDNPLTIYRDCADLKEASRLCLKYVRQHGVKASSWAGGQITEDGFYIATVCHNGKIWNALGQLLYPEGE